MTIPQNPDTIIIKNNYYPKGLREIDIWNYYQKVKIELLKETLGKKLIIFFAIDLNKFTVIRKTKTNEFIRLNYPLYDSIVSGRTISFHNVMEAYSNYGIVDIDTNNFEEAKKLSLELYNVFYKPKFVRDVKIIYTGKDSFHIRIFFNTKYKVEYIKQRIVEILNTEVFSVVFTIKGKREGFITNLDLNRNVLNAGYIALNSLSVDGLKCMEVYPKKIINFKKEYAKIM